MSDSSQHGREDPHWGDAPEWDWEEPEWENEGDIEEAECAQITQLTNAPELSSVLTSRVSSFGAVDKILASASCGGASSSSYTSRDTGTARSVQAPKGWRSRLKTIGFALLLACLLLYLQLRVSGALINASSTSRAASSPSTGLASRETAAGAPGNSNGNGSIAPSLNGLQHVPSSSTAAVNKKVPSSTKPSSQSPRITQDDPNCRAWSLSGECYRNPQFMLTYCSSDCHVVSQHAAAVPGTLSSVTPIATQTAPLSSGTTRSAASAASTAPAASSPPSIRGLAPSDYSSAAWASAASTAAQEHAHSSEADAGTPASVRTFVAPMLTSSAAEAARADASAQRVDARSEPRESAAQPEMAQHADVADAQAAALAPSFVAPAHSIDRHTAAAPPTAITAAPQGIANFAAPGRLHGEAAPAPLTAAALPNAATAPGEDATLPAQAEAQATRAAAALAAAPTPSSALSRGMHPDLALPRAASPDTSSDASSATFAAASSASADASASVAADAQAASLHSAALPSGSAATRAALPLELKPSVAGTAGQSRAHASHAGAGVLRGSHQFIEASASAGDTVPSDLTHAGIIEELDPLGAGSNLDGRLESVNGGLESLRLPTLASTADAAARTHAARSEGEPLHGVEHHRGVDSADDAVASELDTLGGEELISTLKAGEVAHASQRAHSRDNGTVPTADSAAPFMRGSALTEQAGVRAPDFASEDLALLAADVGTDGDAALVAGALEGVKGNASLPIGSSMDRILASSEDFLNAELDRLGAGIIGDVAGANYSAAQVVQPAAASGASQTRPVRAQDGAVGNQSLSPSSSAALPSARRRRSRRSSSKKRRRAAPKLTPSGVVSGATGITNSSGAALNATTLRTNGSATPPPVVAIGAGEDALESTPRVQHAEIAANEASNFSARAGAAATNGTAAESVFRKANVLNASDVEQATRVSETSPSSAMSRFISAHPGVRLAPTPQMHAQSDAHNSSTPAIWPPRGRPLLLAASQAASVQTPVPSASKASVGVSRRGAGDEHALSKSAQSPVGAVANTSDVEPHSSRRFQTAQTLNASLLGDAQARGTPRSASSAPFRTPSLQSSAAPVAAEVAAAPAPSHAAQRSRKRTRRTASSLSPRASAVAGAAADVPEMQPADSTPPQLHGVQHHVPTLPSAALQQPVFSADVAAEAASTTPAARATAAAVDGAHGSGTRALARQPGVRAQFRADSVSSPSVDKASAETASRPLRQKQLSSLLQRVEMMREKRRDLSTP